MAGSPPFPTSHAFPSFWRRPWSALTWSLSAAGKEIGSHTRVPIEFLQGDSQKCVNFYTSFGCRKRNERIFVSMRLWSDSWLTIHQHVLDLSPRPSWPLFEGLGYAVGFRSL